MDVRDGHLQELFERALEGTLSGEDQNRLQAHLMRCPDCEVEFKFAQRTREAWAQAGAGVALSPQELARLEARVMESLEPPRARPARQRTVPTPVLVAGMAAALLLLWLSGAPVEMKQKVGWLMAKSALEFPGVQEPAELRKVQLSAVADLVDVVPAKTGMEAGTGPAPALIADVEVVSDLELVTLAGFVQPELRATAYSGRRALYLSRGGSALEPLEVRVAIAPGQHLPQLTAVSAWLSCREGPATVTLTAGLNIGESCLGEPTRRVQPGEWRWVLFTLPREEVEAGRGLADIRLQIECSGPVLVDRVELWERVDGNEE